MVLVRVGTGSANVILKGAGQHRLLAVTNATTAVVNVLLSVVLIGPFGLAGVAVGTLVPVVVSGALVIFPRACRRVGLPVSTVLRQAVWPAIWPAVGLTAVIMVGLPFAGSRLGGIGALLVLAGLVYEALFVGFAIAPGRAPNLLVEADSAGGQRRGRGRQLRSMAAMGARAARLIARMARTLLYGMEMTERPVSYRAASRPLQRCPTDGVRRACRAGGPIAMYERFYQLRERPFALSPDPDYLYPSRVHREALSYLRYGIEGQAGFVVITGEIGSGKTTLLQTLLRGLDRETTVARLVNTMLEPNELLESILIDFGLEPEPRKPGMLRQLGEFLVNERGAGRLVLLVVDEAQNLTLPALEEVRMLSNLETEKSKLIQIVLVGQPDLREKLGQPELEQLRQRVTVSYHLGPLDAEDTSAYINHRLRRAADRRAARVPGRRERRRAPPERRRAAADQRDL